MNVELSVSIVHSTIVIEYSSSHLQISETDASCKTSQIINSLIVLSEKFKNLFSLSVFDAKNFWFANSGVIGTVGDRPRVVIAVEFVEKHLDMSIILQIKQLLMEQIIWIMIFIIMKIPKYITIILLCLIVVTVTSINTKETLLKQKYQGISDFGMNKPHLLFHVGERSKVSVNYGFGYWQNRDTNDKGKSNFTNTRLRYQNTKNGLYVNMKSHDGSKHVHEQLIDSTYGVQTNIKYQVVDDAWEEHIHLKRGQKRDYNSTSTYWFKYLTVENSDPNLIKLLDTEQKSPINLNLIEHETNSAKVLIEKMGARSQEITIKSSQKLKVFGFSMNISQTYDVRSTMDEVKYLIELQRYKMKKRKNDTDLVKWQDQQIRFIKQNNWINQKYLVLVFYGEFSNECTIQLGNRTAQFDHKHFEKVSTNLDTLYFPEQKYSQHSKFLRHIIYNLYGGQAFYYGVLYTQNSLLRHQIDYSYTFTPSRLLFPRGFLWDDGFHLSIAANYNPSITIDIIHNWMRKIDMLGWIGRQQIRGFEMSSLMPELKFVYQDIFEMNPPTLIMPIVSLIQKVQANELHQTTASRFHQMLQQNFWKIQKWYRYFIKTQSHFDLMQKQSINKTVKYRWRCKDSCERGNFMGSGLDDYPRVQNQAQMSKQHVDLMSWIYFFSQGLQKIAKYLNLEKQQSYYAAKKEQIKNKIYNQCLDHIDLIFKDKVAKGKNIFVDELVTKVGYISLFPFFTGVLREETFAKGQRERIKQVRDKLIEVMMDQNQLLSEDGLRSLSISDASYGTLDNYWRGPVWMPINYLVLRACKKFYNQDEKVQKLYETLRTRLIETTKRSWQKQGYLFQTYHQGKGHRAFPFYGWTSLITNIITEQY